MVTANQGYSIFKKLSSVTSIKGHLTCEIFKFQRETKDHRGRRGQEMRDTKSLPKGRLPVASENEEGIGPAMLLLPLNASMWPTWEFLWDSPGVPGAS